ncbi:MAG: hypothetical protein P8018_11855 [Acidobacteriota bacterium]|jgi:YHS domain-containing protein
MDNTCPVCGGVLVQHSQAVDLVYHELLFRFCSLDCLKVFQRYPEVYGEGEEPELHPVEDTNF